MEQEELDLYGLLEENQLLDESYELEAKSGKGGLPGSLWESYAAFANSEGGTIILGVTEKEDTLEIDGLSKVQITKIQHDFWSQVNNKGKVSANLLTEHQVKVIEVLPGRFIMAIKVPVADYRLRPVHIGPDPLKGTYKRNHTGDYLCTPDEVRQMIADALPQKPDARILEHYSMADLDERTILQFRQLFRSTKPSHPYLTEDDKGLLHKIGAFRTERNSQKTGLTVAGLLMFGKHQAIIDTFPDYHLDYQEIIDPNQRWSDRIFSDGTWEANIFQFYNRVWPKISGLLPQPFQLKDGQRIDETALHEALREALVNALVHADYSAPGGIVIRKYPDYFVFSNPGNMLITVEQYYRGGISIPRNNSIQTMFLLLGLGEKAGSGSTRIFSAWEGLHWRKPYIQQKHQPSRFDLYLRMESLISPKSMDNLVSFFGEGIRNIFGNSLVALTTAQIEGAITNTRLQQLIGDHPSEISKLLKDLCAAGYLFPSGKGRGTVYQLNTQYKPSQIDSTIIPTGTQRSLFESDNSSPISETAKEDTSRLKEDTSRLKEDTSRLKEDTSRLKEDTSRLKEDTSETQKRLTPDALNALIIAYCQTEFKSVEEIGKYSGKKPKYLKDKIIPRLIQQQLIERLYPNTPNHPQQKYKAKA